VTLVRDVPARFAISACVIFSRWTILRFGQSPVSATHIEPVILKLDACSNQNHGGVPIRREDSQEAWCIETNCQGLVFARRAFAEDRRIRASRRWSASACRPQGTRAPQPGNRRSDQDSGQEGREVPRSQGRQGRDRASQEIVNRNAARFPRQRVSKHSVRSEGGKGQSYGIPESRPFHSSPTTRWGYMTRIAALQ
jgi:hypothetical protein